MTGVTPRPVSIEVHLGKTNSKFGLVGLPDTAVREAQIPSPGGHGLIRLRDAPEPR